MCGDAAAPGCNAKSCLLGGDAGVDSGSPHDAALDGPACGSTSGGTMGDMFGSCPGTEECCPGGAAGSYYCYSGTGPCPSVP